jgi:glycosyltransferase involved in cell wall biosynthesis
MVSKACVTASYRAKLTEMVRLGSVDLTVVVPPAWGSLPYEPASDEPFRTIVAPVWAGGRNHLHWYPPLAGIVNDTAPDLMHVDEEHYSLVTYLGFRLAATRSIPAVFFTWQNLYKRYPWPFSAMERYVLSHAAGALAGNREAALILRQKGYTGPLAVVPQFGTDPDVFQPRPADTFRRSWGIGPDAVVVGYVGRLVPEKGLDLLVEAMLPILRGRPDVRLLFCGDGPVRHALKHQVETAQAAERVTWIPWLSSGQMPELMNALDILVLPSRSTPRWKEQFGRVLTEAMAAEVPVIGARSGEIPHVIGDAGLVFAENNPVDLREKIRRLLQDEKLRRALGQAGRARVLEHFTQRRVAEQTLTFYQEVLDHKAGGRKAVVETLEGPTRLLDERDKTDGGKT